MRSIVSGQTALTQEEFAELALGLVMDSEFSRLFIGVPGESEVECEARMDAAADILADLRREDWVLAAYAKRLLSMAPVPLRRSAIGRRTAGSRQAAA
ncbi:hypothetical protein [Kitasatospora sp. NPDC091276]|uniref:hypothetical protein n=1 Tax=Kitasatospora sp. NPDC091276 TaxID=3155300 RepID=UPI00342575B0